MVLSYLFVGFILVSCLIALGELVFTGSFSAFDRLSEALFVQSKNGFEISLYLTGVLCLWMGFMRIASESGLIERLARWSSPLLSVLFPSIPKGDPVFGDMVMNISANILGLDNAATPLGLKAMEGLERLNPQKGVASDAMIMFLSLNASGLMLIPTSIIAYRLQAGAENPADIFIPILIATTAATVTAILMVGIKQKINLWQRPMLLFLGGFLLLTGLVLWASMALPEETFSRLSKGMSSLLVLLIISGFIISGLRAKINVYDAFIEGAKGGFDVAIRLIPYLVAILVAIGLFRASGAMDFITEGITSLIAAVGLDTSFAPAILTMLMKPLSGSGARGLMLEAMQTYGVDSFVGRLVSTVQGVSDTTFYLVAVYFGAVKIRNIRYTVGYALVADFVGMVVAVLVTYLFFGNS